MRIVAVCGFAWEPKGTVRSRAFPLMAELAKLQHDTTLLTIPYDNPEYSGKEFVRDGVKVVNVPLKSRISNLVERTYRAVSMIREIDPDVVHVFKPKGYAGMTAWSLLKQGRFPVCLDCDDWEGWGGWNEVKPYPYVIKEFIDRQERFLMKKSHSVTAASRVLQQRANDSGQLNERIFYVPNCLTDEQLVFQSEIARSIESGARHDADAGKRTEIFYAGHFDPADDIFFFCRSILPALEEGARLTFVGDGQELPKVKAFFPERFAGQIRYIAHLPYRDYLRVLASADLTCFPYPNNPVYRAKCSARILDFMMSGKPVVTTDVGQNSEYIENGVSGILVQAQNEGQFTDAVLDLMRRPDYGRALGTAARKRVEENFMWRNNVMSQCMSAYECARAGV